MGVTYAFENYSPIAGGRIPLQMMIADRALDPPGDFGSEHTDALSTRDRAEDDRRQQPFVVAEAREQEGEQRRHQHAGAGPDDAAARRHRRAHALEAHDEQEGGDEITRLDHPLPGAGVQSRDIHQWPPRLARVPLDLNISSMRSVTT